MPAIWNCAVLACPMRTVPTSHRVLLLDEPERAIGAAGRAWPTRLVADDKTEGGAVVLATHHPPLHEVCDAGADVGMSAPNPLVRFARLRGLLSGDDRTWRLIFGGGVAISALCWRSLPGGGHRWLHPAWLTWQDGTSGARDRALRRGRGGFAALAYSPSRSSRCTVRRPRGPCPAALCLRRLRFCRSAAHSPLWIMS